MSETSNEINVSAEPPKAKSKKLFFIIGLVVLLVAGSAGGYYFLGKTSEAAEAKTEKKKKAASKEDVEEEEIAEETKTDKKEEKTSAKEALKVSLPDDSDVKKVVELQPFIINLADADEARYLRLTVSLGVGEEAGEKPNPLFMTRVKNAMLAVLSSKKSDEILSTEGKAKLRKELLQAAQAASDEPKVEAIYITDFIVQL